MPQQYLSEHQAPDLSQTPAGYQPTDEETRALKLTEQFYMKAKRNRSQYDGHWLEDYRMFRGQQWKEQRPSYRHSEVINMVFQSIQSTVPIQTDSRPRIEFIPENPTDIELSSILNQASQSDWERGNWLQTLTEIIYDSNFYGTGIGGVECDPEGDNGLPQITFESDDLFYAFPDPNARDMNGKRTRGYLTAEPVDASVLKAEYPDKAEWIKADLVDIVDQEKKNSDQIKYKSPVDSLTPVDGVLSPDLGTQDKVLKYTYYLYPDEFTEEEQTKKSESGDALTDAMGQPEVEYVQKLKYPNGRKICVASGVVLSDGPIPYEDGKIPKARLVNYLDPRAFFGISEVEQLRSPQRMFNKVLSFALDIMTLMGNPIWVVDTEAGIDTDNLYNRPGLVVEKNQGSEVRRESGVEINQSLFGLVDRIRQWFDGVSGSQDISRGAKPEGVSAASAITALQDAAQTRLRLKARHLDAFLQEIGQLWLSRAFQFYTSPRIFRLTENQESQKFFKMHFAPVTDETGQPVIGPDGNPRRKAIVRDYVTDPNTGQMSESLEAREFEMMGRFDVRVGTGSSLPFAKAEKFAMAEKLFAAGVIDDEELLKQADYPNWEAVLARTMQKRQEQQKAAMAAPPGAPPMDPMAPPA